MEISEGSIEILKEIHKWLEKEGKTDQLKIGICKENLEELIEITELSKDAFCTMSKESLVQGVEFEEKLVINLDNGCSLMEWNYKGTRYCVYSCECDKHPLFISPSRKLYKLKIKKNPL